MADLVKRNSLQREVRCPGHIIVTSDAILIQKGALPFDRYWSLSSMQREGACKPEHHSRKRYTSLQVVSLPNS
jgi:antirestriction protein ArdC